MSDELKNKMEEASKLLHDFQEKYETLENSGKATTEELEKMKEDFVSQAEAVAEMKQALEAEEKARQDLELALARTGERASSEDVKGSPEYADAFVKYMKHREAIDADVQDEEFKGLVASVGGSVSDQDLRAVKTMLVGSNPDGGYLVPVQTMTSWIKRLYETSPMRQLATVVTTSAEAIEYPIDDNDGFTSGWVGEVEDRDNTDTAKIGMLTIPTHEQYANPVATQKILDDAVVSIEQWISGKVIDKFARTEKTAFVNGTGVKQPVGFMTLPDWTALAAYERGGLETRETEAATLAGDDLINLQTDLLEGYQGNARWTMHRKVFAEIMKLKDSDNQYLLNPAMIFQGAMGPQLLGKPVVFFGDMSSTVDEGDYVLAYGDFRAGYTIVDRLGIRVLRDPYTSKGFVQFYTTKRVGGAVTNYQAIKRLKILESTT